MFALSIPNDLNYVIQKMLNVPFNDLSRLVNLIIESENNYQNINVQPLTTKLNMSLEEVENFFGLLLLLIRWCQQHRSYSEREVKNDLVERGFTEDWSNHFWNLIINKDKYICTRNYLPQIRTLAWRIDTSFDNNTLKKPMPPTIIWNLKLTNGKQHIIEMNIKKFHEIRFHIATLLKELGILKNNTLLKK